MDRQFGGQRIPEQLHPVERNLFDEQLIERTRQILRQPQRLPGPALVAALDQAGEQHQPLHRCDGWRDLRAVFERVQGAADPFVEFGVADRDQTRKQQSALRAPDECVLDRALCTVVRNQHDPARKACRLAPVTLEQSGRQRIREGAVRGDGENGRCHDANLAIGSRRSRP